MARVCWCGLPAWLYLLESHSAFQPSWGWGDLNFFQLLGSNSSPESVWNLGAYILPHTKVTESNCWVLSDPEGGKNNFYGTLEGTSTHRIALSIRSEMSTYAMWQFIPFHDVRLHRVAFLFFVVGLCWSARIGLLIVCPSKPTQSKFPSLLPVRLPFSISIFSVQSQGVFFFCLAIKKIVHKQFVSYAFN
jgi:hypothetical protein